MKKIFLILMPLLIVAGCGSNIFEGMDNKSSKAANALDVTKKLDNRNYDAILNDPNANALDYAAAAMGKAGLDPVELINKLNDLASGTVNNDLSSIASLNLNPDALGALQTAKNKLNEALAANPDDADLNFQMVVTSVTSTLTTIAKVGENLPGVDVTDGISDLEAQTIANNITSATTVGDVNGDGQTDNAVTLIANDIVDVVDSLPKTNLGANSELNTVLTDVATSPTGINYGCTTDVNGKCISSDTVTDTDISNYLKNTFGSAQ